MVMIEGSIFKLYQSLIILCDLSEIVRHIKETSSGHSGLHEESARCSFQALYKLLTRKPSHGGD